MHMPYEFLSKTFSFFPSALRVIPFGGGEPLLSPHFLELVESAKRYETEVYFNTNGTTLTKDIARRLVDLDVDRINFSVDGATEKTFESIRKGAKFITVINNIAALDAIKREQCTSLPIIGITFICMAGNMYEVPQLLSLCRDIGVQLISFESLISPGSTWNAEYKEFFQRQTLANLPKHELLRFCKDCDKRAKDSGIRIFPPDYFSRLYKSQNNSESSNASTTCVKDDTHQKCTGNIQTGAPKCNFFCTSPWTTVYITANGLVQTCCFSSRIFGDLRDQDLAEIWNGEKFRSYRKQIIQGICPDECKICFKNDRNSREVNILPLLHVKRYILTSVKELRTTSIGFIRKLLFFK
jgi:MoaA/NifB/PqqE/SkfB family radical SAM enzyme